MLSRKILGILLVFLGMCIIWPASHDLEAQYLQVARVATNEGKNSNLESKQGLDVGNIVRNRSPRTNIKVFLRADKSPLKPGDELHITVETNRDCYLTLLYPSSESNKVTVPLAKSGIRVEEQDKS